MKKLACIITTFLWVHYLLIGAPREQERSWNNQQTSNKRHSVAIISSDGVGKTIAYTLLLKKLDLSIILVDNNTQLYAPRTSSFIDNLSAQPHNLRQGNFKDAGQADIIIIALSAYQKENQPLAELIKKNKALLTQCIHQMIPLNSKATILVITEPVDLMTYYVHQKSGLGYNQVFGIGTYLETEQLRTRISKLLCISAKSMNAFILGEHGDNQVTAWSSASIAGIPIQQMYPYIEQINKNIQHKKSDLVEDQAIIEHFNISNCVTAIIKSILFNKKKIMPVSCYNTQHSIYFSQPAVVGEYGIERIFTPQLTTQEQEKLDYCIHNISQMIQL